MDGAISVLKFLSAMLTFFLVFSYIFFGVAFGAYGLLCISIIIDVFS